MIKALFLQKRAIDMVPEEAEKLSKAVVNLGGTGKMKGQIKKMKTRWDQIFPGHKDP